MPAGAIAQALQQLRDGAAARLEEARLSAAQVEVFGTPRRLILRAQGVPSRQPDQERQVRGPARSVAFDAAGKPTGAAIGFARKQGVPVESLEIIGTPQGEYVQARVTDLGQPAHAVLGEVLAETVRSLTFPKMMRWGENTARYVRPLRWIVALLDSELIPMEIIGVRSDRVSRGHRTLAPHPFTLDHADDLLTQLPARFVMYDPMERERRIQEQAQSLAQEVGGTILWDEGLLEENVYLVEWPTVFLGRFDPVFLELPRPVLVTAMKKHQRYFPVEDAQGRLLPFFIAVRNGNTAHLEIVREGNERVLTARFTDARFFYQQDREVPLERMAERLGRLIFQEKLGTMAQKRERLERLVKALAEARGLPEEEQSLAVRAARLCKADLVSQMVIELPALQGIMGREYALAAGEDPRIADAIAEHYLPRSAADALPVSLTGSLLAVADRLDTLVGYVGLGILPSGSSDPYGLRRAAQGLIQLLARDTQMPALTELILDSADIYAQVNQETFDLPKLHDDLRGLCDQRVEAFLQERGIRYDLIDATLAGGGIYSSLVCGTIRRAETLRVVSQESDFIPNVQAAARTSNILRAAGVALLTAPLSPGGAARAHARLQEALTQAASQISAERLQDPREVALYEAAVRLIPEAARLATDYEYAALYRALGSLRETVNAFFDHVMVMAKEEELRVNRLALLHLVDSLYRTLADFTRVVVA
jgi:glycyl-tRNA synthetase beta chain